MVPATTTAEEILARNPDGVLLSNGPGDPAATGEYAVPEIRKLVDSGKPVFGICLGHQMLALALGAKTVKMDQGHHGANHPVKDLTTGKVEIVSMNHGFTVDRDSLPEPVMETHVSLFDGTNAGIALKDRPVFGVQHHPEASPGPDGQPLPVRALRRAHGRSEGLGLFRHGLRQGLPAGAVQAQPSPGSVAPQHGLLAEVQRRVRGVLGHGDHLEAHPQRARKLRRPGHVGAGDRLAHDVEAAHRHRHAAEPRRGEGGLRGGR